MTTRLLALLVLVLALATYRLFTRSAFERRVAPSAYRRSMSVKPEIAPSTLSRPTQPKDWRAALASLPDHPARLPAFFFAHGSPSLIMHDASEAWKARMGPDGCVGGRQEAFLQDFGRTLIDKYKPKAIVVFSAHWDTDEEILVSDYQGKTPILYDYFGFQPSMYEHDFVSHGDAALSRKIVSLLHDARIPARLLGPNEPRGMDGKTQRPGNGFDHGVLVPFRIMFDDSGPDGFPIPIVQVSIWGNNYDPAQEAALGAAVRSLRDEGVLILSGGLVYHNLRSFSGFNEATASPLEREWNEAVLSSVETSTVKERQKKMAALERHPAFRHAHPQADHFAPIWVGSGAGSEDAEGSGARIVSALYGASTIAFL